jgi:hypothetical protein
MPLEQQLGSVAYHAFIFLSGILSGGTTFGIVAHAVDTFPMPKSEIGRWFLGLIQFAVGQREKGKDTMDGPGAAQALRDTAEGK